MLSQESRTSLLTSLGSLKPYLLVAAASTLKEKLTINTPALLVFKNSRRVNVFI